MAVVLSPEGRFVGAGYNGSPPGQPHCAENCPRLNEDSPPGAQYGNCISVHAEANALMYSNRSERKDGSLVINGQPCWDCGKLIAGSGIGRLVIFGDESYEDSDRVNEMIGNSGVEVIIVERDRIH